MNKSTHKLLLSITASILAVGGANAYELTLSTNMPSLDVHGFLSQGFLLSSDYNYLTPDSTSGSLKFTEAALNLSINPLPRTRITAQVFTFDVGKVGQYDILLDYASAEYTFSDSLGVRVGRVRRPGGIYNSIQDIDLARTSVLLPQGIYDARWRDFSGTIDGGEIFGTVSLDQAGSLSYETYIGYVNMGKNGGVARAVENGLPPAPLGQLDSIDSALVYGSQFWYNTPLDGLRVGVSVGYFQNFEYSVTVPVPPTYTRMQINTKAHIPFQQYSVEYQHNSWTFQAEYFTYNLSGHQNIGSSTIKTASSNPDSWYIGASYRFNKWFELGGYYNEYYGDVHNRSNAQEYQKDLALSLRFDPTDWWIIKAEGHYINGTGLLNDDANNPVRDGRGWFMLALKTTFSF